MGQRGQILINFACITFGFMPLYVAFLLSYWRRVMADRLTTHDVDVATKRQIIIVKLKIVNEELSCKLFVIFGLPFQRKQLPTSPAAARGPLRSAYDRPKGNST